MTITDSGDPSLADGSAGSGVDLGSIPAPATFDTSGSHTTTSTVKEHLQARLDRTGQVPADGFGIEPVSGAIAEIDVAKIDNDVDGTFVEAVSTSAATTGNLFREAGDGQYIFNLSTKSPSKGDWRVKITLDDGTEYTVRISLK